MTLRHATLREDSPDHRDSWNRTWTFFEWHLRPYDDKPRR